MRLQAYNLSLAYEAFHVDYDVTTIDQQAKVTEIHQPDGKNDILQQIEHGMLSVVGGYRSLGRLYRGIICNDLRQYVLLGDSSAMTDGVKGNEDDRWVFTEENPPRELMTAAHLAAASRALEGYNDALSKECLDIAEELYEITDGSGKARAAKSHAAVELYLTTDENKYREHLLSEADFIAENIQEMGWIISRVEKKLADEHFTETILGAMQGLMEQLEQQSAETPYGIPYRCLVASGVDNLLLAGRIASFDARAASSCPTSWRRVKKLPLWSSHSTPWAAVSTPPTTSL